MSYEQMSISDGIDSELRAPVGQHVLWVEFDSDATEVDSIYDVADYRTTGRQWKFPPVRIPAFTCAIRQGPTVHNDRGFYNADTLHLGVAMNVIERLYPSLAWEPDAHIKDRVLYRGNIFVPVRFGLQGLLRDTYTVFTVDANQVNPEEHVNDPQLTEWATATLYPPGQYAPQMKKVGSDSTL